MPEHSEQSVLRRMAALRADRVGLSEMTSAKALRNAIAKAGDDVLGAVAVVTDVAEEVLGPDDLGQDMPDPALFVMLDGPGGARGLAVACPQVVGAVIEASTISKVLHTAAPDRRPTRTDAMLVTGFLDPAMGGFAALSVATPGLPPVDGFACGLAQADLRTALMSLSDVPYRQFRIELDFAGGAKKGVLYLIYPAERAPGLGTSIETREWNATLENAVLGTTARLEAVLCRTKLPLAEITALKVGDVLGLDGASLDGVSLIGTNGRRMMTARLGRSGPVRAVRICLDGKAPPRRPSAGAGAAMGGMQMHPQPGGMADAPSPGAGGGATVDAPPMAAEMDIEAMAPLDAAPLDAAPMEPQPLDTLDMAEPLPLS